MKSQILKPIAKAAISMLLIFCTAAPLAAQQRSSSASQVEYTGYKENLRTSRNAFFICAEENFQTLDFSKIDFSNLPPDFFMPKDLTLNFTWGMDKIFFTGIDAGISCSSIASFNETKELLLKGGSTLGIAVNLKNLRPYIAGTAEYYSNRQGNLKAGAGLDLKFGAFLITMGYSFNWNFELDGIINTFQSSGVYGTFDWTSLNPNTSHSFYLGTGFTW